MLFFNKHSYGWWYFPLPLTHWFSYGNSEKWGQGTCSLLCKLCHCSAVQLFQLLCTIAHFHIFCTHFSHTFVHSKCVQKCEKVLSVQVCKSLQKCVSVLKCIKVSKSVRKCAKLCASVKSVQVCIIMWSVQTKSVWKCAKLCTSVKSVQVCKLTWSVQKKSMKVCKNVSSVKKCVQKCLVGKCAKVCKSVQVCKIVCEN